MILLSLYHQLRWYGLILHGWNMRRYLQVGSLVQNQGEMAQVGMDISSFAPGLGYQSVPYLPLKKHMHIVASIGKTLPLHFSQPEDSVVDGKY